MVRRPYHELMGLLGTGDLHPGGADASELLLSWLRREIPGTRVLEIGAGIGRTTQRLVKTGWNVTAIEPASRLYQRLKTVRGARARQESLNEHQGSYDGIIAESVLYGLPLDESLTKIRTLLQPQGVFAFVEMVWTPAADPDRTRAIHDQTREIFGVPIASRERLTWPDWRLKLGNARFAMIEERRLGDGSPGKPTQEPSLKQALTMLIRPRLFVDKMKTARAERRFRLPKGWLESWACAARAD